MSGLLGPCLRGGHDGPQRQAERRLVYHLQAALRLRRVRYEGGLGALDAAEPDVRDGLREVEKLLGVHVRHNEREQAGGFAEQIGLA